MCTVPSWKGGVRSDDFAHTYDRSLELSEDAKTDLPPVVPACGGTTRAHPVDERAR